MKSKINERYIQHDDSRINQGDIFRDVPVQVASQDKIETIILPYIVVLTQDCDLESDFKARAKSDGSSVEAYLQMILICPAYLASQLREGTHLEGAGLVGSHIGSDRWGNIKKSQDPRYQFLFEYPEYQIPELVMDFKHYYTFRREDLYKMKDTDYIATLNELFRESLAQRFSYYLSRIGLPIIKEKEE